MGKCGCHATGLQQACAYCSAMGSLEVDRSPGETEGRNFDPRAYSHGLALRLFERCSLIFLEASVMHISNMEYVE